ncbi:MAG: hypothetical protein KBS66_00670 [Eubacterium sp.]|nr:hypothetical protein [Candidatus Colimonas fimequi]
MKTQNGLTELYEVCVHKADGTCSWLRAYDYDIRDGWIIVDGIATSMYIRETIVDSITIKNIIEDNTNANHNTRTTTG